MKKKGAKNTRSIPTQPKPHLLCKEK
jgi:hypothetical protein